MFLVSPLSNGNLFYMVFEMSLQSTVHYRANVAITTSLWGGSKFKLITFSISTKPSLDPRSPMHKLQKLAIGLCILCISSKLSFIHCCDYHSTAQKLSLGPYYPISARRACLLDIFKALCNLEPSYIFNLISTTQQNLPLCFGSLLLPNKLAKT